MSINTAPTPQHRYPESYDVCPICLAEQGNTCKSTETAGLSLSTPHSDRTPIIRYSPDSKSVPLA